MVELRGSNLSVPIVGGAVGGVLVIVIFLVLVTVLTTVKCRTRLGPEFKPNTDASLGKSGFNSCLKI